jgi:hypothetical protein
VEATFDGIRHSVEETMGSSESPISLVGLAEPLSTVKVNLPTPFPTQTLPGEDITSSHTPIAFQSPGLDVVFDTLVPSYRGLIDPILLSTYLGQQVHQQPVMESKLDPINKSQGNAMAWSRGIGVELSPLKTRSPRKKSGQSSVPVTNPATTYDSGLLRGMKALAKAKP